MNLIKKTPLDKSITDFVNEFFGDNSTIKWEYPILRRTDLGAVNIKEDKEKYSLEVCVPSFKKDDIDIEIEDDLITIKGKVEDVKNDAYSRHEFVKQSFVRSFTLPEDVDVETIKAEVKDGVLHLEIKRKEVEEKTKIKKIEIY